MELELSVKNKESERFSIQTQHLTELVCPVCFEYMQPPIMLCERGHSICQLCHELMSNCPLCHGKLTCRRSSALEALTTVMRFPCKHCHHKFLMEDLTSHNCFQTSDSDHSPIATCIIGQVYGECVWSGSSTDIAAHYAKSHPRNFWTSNENATKWKCSNLSNIGVQNAFVVDLKEAIFVIVQKYDCDSNSLRWNLSCECKTNEQYHYEIQVGSAPPDVFVRRKKITNSFNILTIFPNKNEITLCVDKIIRYINDDNVIEYKIVISKGDEFIEDENVETSQRSSQSIKMNDEETLNKNETSCFQKAWNSVTLFYNSLKKTLHL